MDENWDANNDYKDGNEELKDPGRRGRRRPEEPWTWQQSQRSTIS